MILEGLRLGRSRTIGLGRADDRYFTFCAGLRPGRGGGPPGGAGPATGRVSTPSLYLRSTVSQYFLGSDRRHPAITLERPGEQAEAELATVIIQNTAPWTYLGDREVNPNPDASFDLGLDVMALRQLRVASTTRTVTQFLSRHPDPRGGRCYDCTTWRSSPWSPAVRRRSSWTATTSASGKKSDSPPFPPH